MPASPWKTLREVKPEQDYLVQLTYLPLKRYSTIFRFLRFTSAIKKQLGCTEGVVGFSMRASPLKRDFWTLSVWTDREALLTFTQNAPHGQIMDALDGHMRKTAFIEWQIKGSELPPSWEDALKRFAARQAV